MASYHLMQMILHPDDAAEDMLQLGQPSFMLT